MNFIWRGSKWKRFSVLLNKVTNRTVLHLSHDMILIKYEGEDLYKLNTYIKGLDYCMNPIVKGQKGINTKWVNTNLLYWKLKVTVYICWNMGDNPKYFLLEQGRQSYGIRHIWTHLLNFQPVHKWNCLQFTRLFLTLLTYYCIWTPFYIFI